jgi:hypothetical protein
MNSALPVNKIQNAENMSRRKISSQSRLFIYIDWPKTRPAGLTRQKKNRAGV